MSKMRTLLSFAVTGVITSALAFSAFAAVDIQTAPAKAAVYDYTTIRLDPEAKAELPELQPDDDGNQYYVTKDGIILTVDQKDTNAVGDTGSVISFVPDVK